MVFGDDARPFVIHERSCPLEDWSRDGRAGVTWRTLLSGDRTPTHSLTLGVADIEPGAPDVFHLHRHEPAEAYYVLAGTGVVSIDRELHEVHAGSAVFVPPNALHAVANTGTDLLRVLYVFGVDSFDDVNYEFPDDATA